MPAQLHHEILGGEGARAWLLCTHGIYGTGGNWRSIARQVVTRRPEWGAVLVDLRLHGRSEAGPPPHTVAACAGDLAALIEALGAGGRTVHAALGHSFGGKCVLALRPLGELRQLWILDSTPSARPGEWDAPDNSVRAVWDAMHRHDRVWPRREDFVAALVADGHAPTLANWLAMNLAPVEGGLRLRLDLDGVRALLLDYYAQDLWPVLAQGGGEVRMVVARRSWALSPDDRARLAALPATAAVQVHELEAGHWLNLEAPGPMVELIADGLPAP